MPNPFVSVNRGPKAVVRLAEVQQMSRETLIRRDYRPTSWVDDTVQVDVVPQVVPAQVAGADDGTALFGGVVYRPAVGYGQYAIGSNRSAESWQESGYPGRGRGLVIPLPVGQPGSTIVLARVPRPADYMLGYRANPSVNDPGSSATPLGYG